MACSDLAHSVGVSVLNLSSPGVVYTILLQRLRYFDFKEGKIKTIVHN